MNKNIKTEIAIGIILLISIPVGLLFILQNRKLNNEIKIEEKVSISENVKKELPKEGDKIFCTQDAKQCSDGSYVSRTGPNCDFAECPYVENSFENIIIPSGKSSLSNDNILKKYIENNLIIEGGFSYSNGVFSGNGNNYLVGENFRKSILKDEKKSYWRISSAIFINPEDKNILLFSVFNPISEDLGVCENSIYSYNIKNGNLIKFYQQIDEYNSPWKDRGSDNCRNLEVFGLQGSRLIMIELEPESNPGFCVDYWSDYNFYYLELSDINKGLNKFNVPSEKLIESKKEAEECYQELTK